MIEQGDINFECVRPIEEHAKFVMQWRNDPETLKMSYHHEPKRWPSFFKEFRQEYFLIPSLPSFFVIYEGRKVAFLRLTEKKHPTSKRRSCCEIGINIAPEYRGKGLGAKILIESQKLIFQLAYDAVYAEVREKNTVSQKVFSKAGYQLTGKEEKEVVDTGEKCHILKYLLELTPASSFCDDVFIIAEAGSNWRVGTPKRDRAMARSLIDVAVEAGADAVKFQTYRPDSVYVSNAGSSDYLSDAGIKEDITEIFADLAMPYEMIPELAEYCKDKQIGFMSTPFSKSDFEAVNPFVEIHKIASYEISHLRLIELMARSQKPLIMSTGASSERDIRWAVDTFYHYGGKDLTLMQCTAKYPADITSMNLSVIPNLKKKFRVAVGLSDHSRHPTHAPVAAVALGATVIEKHYTLDNRLPGPDHAFAITPEELKGMVSAIREVEKMLGDAEKKVYEAEEELHNYARRGIQAIRVIKEGESFREGVNIDILRPGKQSKGIHPKFLLEMEGKMARRDIAVGHGIRKGDWDE